jgi:hypothetical protein
MHTPERLGNKKPILWNIAADYEIHNMWYMFSKMNEYDPIDKLVVNQYKPLIDKILFDTNKYGFCYDDKYLENVAEEIYESLLESKNNFSKSQKVKLSDLMNSPEGESIPGDCDGIEVEVDVEEYTLPNGTKVKDVNIKWPEKNQLPGSLKQDEKAEETAKNNVTCNRSLLENTLQQIAKEKGDDSSPCSVFIKKLFHVKIDWEKILRNSLQTILDKSDYFAWSNVRTSTFLLPGMPYLPDVVEDNEKYGTIVISRDESGSMTETDLAKAVDIITQAKDKFKKIILLKHDTNIVSVEEFTDITNGVMKSLFERQAFGGTSHKKVFEFLREYQENHRDEERISCYIGITDMESDIIDYQKIIPANLPVIYLAPYETVSQYKDAVNGTVIPVES